MISIVSLFLTLSLTLRMLVSIVNFEHISHLPRREKCRNTCFILQEKKSKFNRLKIEVFFLPNIGPPV